MLINLQLVMLTWSYFMVVFRDPGSVPANWKMLSDQNVEEDNSTAIPSSSEDTERRPAIGYCNRCQNGKPPRCHHCSVCKRCVLKMDHHCIWVVNCVGACNYKFFLLFVLYTFLETLMDTLVLLPSFISFFQQVKNSSSSPGKLAVTFLAFGNFHYNNHHCIIMLNFPFSSMSCFLQNPYLDAVVNLAFALSLLCFVVMHASLLLSNTTSVEVHEKRKDVRWKYDLGWKNNIEQVFGTKKMLWFFPLFSKEDLERVPALHGLDFPTRSDIEEKGKEKEKEKEKEKKKEIDL
ncbi:hypothetical protein RD792_004475 [Penstemon davidsonii]|uniref:S-acyltransferase n=1 Tax=Penstemon davidsonii TaxID=160366 RepID=A0ABR0DIP5_9LAMI|nr:hypothetical protein RD792_004475 [Penstemon davidsonii]